MKKLLKITGVILVLVLALAALASCDAAGRGGIESIKLTGTDGPIDTYTITYTDGSTSIFVVTNGEDGIQGIQGEAGKDGKTPVITIQNGNWYIDGVDTGKSADGMKGDTGKGISAVNKSTSGLTDTYTITFTDNTDYTFTVSNGVGIRSVKKTDTVGLVDIYTITFTDNTTDTFQIDRSYSGVVLITGYVSELLKANPMADLSDAIQRAIDENPNKTIYFPDGTYYIRKPIKTPADAGSSVSLKLSNYAIIKADRDYWISSYPQPTYTTVNGVSGYYYGEDPALSTEFNLGDVSYAMIMLGGKTNNSFNASSLITQNGSNYFLEGGIIDGSGVANGVGIENGRETRVADLSIKNTPVGLYIRWGANSGSSDADISNVNIVCAQTGSSVGLLVRGIDNTFTNMRIAQAQTGVKLLGGGNFLDNIHPLFRSGGANSYVGSIAFHDRAGANFYDNCYSDQFETGFSIDDSKSKASVFDNCFVFWYQDSGNQVAFHCTADDGFHCLIKNARVGFKGSGNATDRLRTFFKMDNPTGTGAIEYPIYNTGIALTDDNLNEFLHGSIIHLTSN